MNEAYVDVDEAAPTVAFAPRRPTPRAVISRIMSPRIPMGTTLILEAEGRSERFQLSPDQPLIIGRTAGADFVLPEDTVSRRHARLAYEAGAWTIEALPESSGTFVNEVPVHRPVTVAPGDRVRLGRVSLIVRAGGAEPLAAPEVSGEGSGAIVIRDGIRWSPPAPVLDAVLDRLGVQLGAADALITRLRRARRGVADLRGVDPASVRRLLDAAGAAYVELLDRGRLASEPDPEEMADHLGDLIASLRGDERAGRLAPGAMSVLDLTVLERAIRTGPRALRVFVPLLDDRESARALLLRMVDEVPGGESSAIVGLAFLPEAAREPVLLQLAAHPRESVRYNLFRLLTRSERVPQPGTLPLLLSPAGTDELIRAGLSDSSPEVRERAAALAYGARLADRAAEALLAGAADPDPAARSLCLLALGLLGDERSLGALEQAFERGSDRDAIAAVWALARRPDGVDIAARAAADPRPGVQLEAISALMHVAEGLSDERLAWLDAPERPPGVKDALRAYRARQSGRPNPC